jgi:hypothetical protein
MEVTMETTTVFLTSKLDNKNGLMEYIIKNKKKIFAKIYPPNKYHEGIYSIELWGMQWLKPMLQQCREFIIQMAEAKLNVFGFSCSVIITDKE